MAHPLSVHNGAQHEKKHTHIFACGDPRRVIRNGSAHSALFGDRGVDFADQCFANILRVLVRDLATALLADRLGELLHLLHLRMTLLRLGGKLERVTV
jgi:hypothetical protein